jgi:hypothetical protein
MKVVIIIVLFVTGNVIMNIIDAMIGTDFGTQVSHVASMTHKLMYMAWGAFIAKLATIKNT